VIDHNRILSVLKEDATFIGIEDYFRAAVLLPLLWFNNQFHVLFEERSANIKQGGEICFPGGKFEPEKDHNFKDTALRETCEELNIDENLIEYYGYQGLMVAPMGAAIDCFVGRIHLDSIKDINFVKSEVEKIFTIPLQWFIDNEPEIYGVNVKVENFIQLPDGQLKTILPVKELNLPQRYQKPWGNKQHKVLVYRTNHGTLWGLTARIVYDFAKRLR